MANANRTFNLICQMVCKVPEKRPLPVEDVVTVIKNLVKRTAASHELAIRVRSPVGLSVVISFMYRRRPGAEASRSSSVNLFEPVWLRKYAYVPGGAGGMLGLMY